MKQILILALVFLWSSAAPAIQKQSIKAPIAKLMNSPPPNTYVKPTGQGLSMTLNSNPVISAQKSSKGLSFIRKNLLSRN